MMKNLAKYTFPTKNGLLLSTELIPNNNMLLSTGMLLFLCPNVENADKYLQGMKDCELSYGAFSRSDIKLINTTVDDYTGITLIPEFAKRMIWRGRLCLGFLNVEHKYLFFIPPKQWIYRFQGMWQTAKMRMGSWVGPLGRLIWSISLELAAQQSITSQDNWIQSHLSILVYRKSGIKSLRCEQAIEIWKHNKTVPTSKIMADYITDPEHPLVEAWSYWGFNV